MRMATKMKTATGKCASLTTTTKKTKKKTKKTARVPSGVGLSSLCGCVYKAWATCFTAGLVLEKMTRYGMISEFVILFMICIAHIGELQEESRKRKTNSKSTFAPLILESTHKKEVHEEEKGI